MVNIFGLNGKATADSTEIGWSGIDIPEEAKAFLFPAAAGCQVTRAAGVQSEMELPFAGLHQLCGPMLGYTGRLPGPQQDALQVAFGVTAGAPPEAFLVGLAVLGLLCEAAAERPLICVIDDTDGWTWPRRRRSGSWRDGWRPIRSGWCSPAAHQDQRWPPCRAGGRRAAG